MATQSRPVLDPKQLEVLQQEMGQVTLNDKLNSAMENMAAEAAAAFEPIQQTVATTPRDIQMFVAGAVFATVLITLTHFFL